MKYAQAESFRNGQRHASGRVSSNVETYAYEVSDVVELIQTPDLFELQDGQAYQRQVPPVSKQLKPLHSTGVRDALWGQRSAEVANLITIMDGSARTYLHTLAPTWLHQAQFNTLVHAFRFGGGEKRAALSRIYSQESKLLDWVAYDSLEIAEPLHEASKVQSVFAEILALRDGWNGPQSIAPSDTVKLTVSKAIGFIAQYLPSAEIEVDPSSGEVTFQWFHDKDTRVVSIAIVPSGRLVVSSAGLDRPTTRVVLHADELDRLSRTVSNAGLQSVNV